MRNRFIAIASAMLLIAGGVWLNRPLEGQDGGAFGNIPEDEVTTGYRVAPVPLNLNGKDPRLVGYGSYLVNVVAVCVDCHTGPSPYTATGNPYMGMPKQINTAAYLAGGVAFGPFTSRNITPAANGMPAGLTREQFKLEFTKGIDLAMLHPQLGPLLQVMPWPAYENMDNTQINAIYEYLSAIPAIKTASGN